jgi:hypothetical protein
METDPTEVAASDEPAREVRAPSTDALDRLEADLAELEAELAALESDDGGDA